MKVEIGNPQETIDKLTPAEWGWLAGLIDGEGCIAMNIRQKRVKQWNGSGIDLNVSVSNTDSGIILKFTELVNRIGIEPYSIEIQPGKYQNHLKNPITSCSIGRMSDMYHFLAGIRPYLAGQKKAKSTLIMKFIERRKSYQGPRTNKPGSSWFVENDWQIVRDFYTLCRKELPEKLNQLLREHTSNSKEMICSELNGDIKSAAEMSASAA